MLFDDRLIQSIANAKRHNESFALLFIDLDNFKEINDTLGHHIGDKVLQLISKKLSNGHFKQILKETFFTNFFVEYIVFIYFDSAL